MQKSIESFSQAHNIPINLHEKVFYNLLYSPCEYCFTKTDSTKRTYQNVGLRKWKKGYVNKNVFPLCNKCYLMRNGLSKGEFYKNVINIVFRRPVMQQMMYTHQSKCKKVKNIRLCKTDKCEYCHSINNLSINKIDPKFGYTVHNVQTLCWTCNRMKSNLKESDFFKHIYKLFWIIQSLKLSTSNASSSSSS